MAPKALRFFSQRSLSLSVDCAHGNRNHNPASIILFGEIEMFKIVSIALLVSSVGLGSARAANTGGCNCPCGSAPAAKQAPPATPEKTTPAQKTTPAAPQATRPAPNSGATAQGP